jgi:hypothetical protein
MYLCWRQLQGHIVALGRTPSAIIFFVRPIGYDDVHACTSDFMMILIPPRLTVLSHCRRHRSRPSATIHNDRRKEQPATATKIASLCFGTYVFSIAGELS